MNGKEVLLYLIRMGDSSSKQMDPKQMESLQLGCMECHEAQV